MARATLLTRMELPEDQKHLLILNDVQLVEQLDPEAAAAELYRRAFNKLVKKQQA
jgi:hypothetical protein